MSKKKEERLTAILQLITEKEQLDVTSLASHFNVSQVTMRKDLDLLESRGLISREHGFAHLKNTDDISSRLAYHYNEKRHIALKAAEMIHDGDTVMIENGSCCAILADILASTKKDLTIITNSAFIADYIRDYPEATTVLLGGIYQKDSQCLVGPMIRDTASNFNIRYFFAGTDGFSQRTGFTNKDQMRAQAVRDMAHSCENLIILTESQKFQTIGTVPLNIKQQPKIVITDQGIDQRSLSLLKDLDIDVVIV